jgi:glycogen phosphorylase
MTSAINPFLARTHIAYFSMEIAIRPEMHTYAGGLGGLAGDTARSCADLEIPAVFVTLASRAGYFRQEIDADGRQVEQPDWWEPTRWCVALNAMVAIDIEDRLVWIRPWLYVHTSPHGHKIPMLLLDTDLEQNSSEDRTLTHHLYGGDGPYRLKQEIVLGIGGTRLLRALGFDLHTYHLNEGHAALLTLELMSRHRLLPEDVRPGESSYDLAEVRACCVFTTHTPVEAGHDRFSYELFERLLPGTVASDELRHVAGGNELNLTQLALNLSGYVNGVARRHAETARHMYPGYRVHAITNGVHAGTWTHRSLARLLDAHILRWQHEPELLVRALQLPGDEVWKAHQEAKADLIALVGRLTGSVLDPAQMIIGFARRMTGYKRPHLLFEEMDRLVAIASQHPFQVIMAGKAHPRDVEGKETIRQLHDLARRLRGKISCVFLPNYDMQMAQTMVAGADVWLNTPLPPLEASGTSGMKAALNGVLNFSVLDGWWVEACVEGVTGWAIGDDGGDASSQRHAAALYEKLETRILPLHYSERERWHGMMKQAIGSVGYYFNSQRMMRRYASEAYLR